MVTLVLAALVLPRSFALVALSDVIQAILLLAGTISFIPRAVRAQGRMRLFWALISLGIGLWFVSQLTWVYFEVLLRQEVPSVFSGDIVLFLHIVPLMAALALRPHIPSDEYAARLRRLDFAMLTLWWIYLYVLIVLPWQFAVPNELAYLHNLNAIYLVEKVVFLGVLVAFAVRSRDRWRVLYANLFGASFLYAVSSHFANWAVAHNVYYSGSLYDVPLVTSMAWIPLIGLWSRVHDPKAETAAETTRKASTSYGVWVARCGMIAAFSLPLFAAWALWNTAVPLPIRSFRLIVTLMSALAMGTMVFVRQRMLDRELVTFFHRSQESIEKLKRLQAQILQSEKLASIGQLVGGAAHELNNPLTAMLGYSDLLLNTGLNPEQRAQAVKIGQHVRRTRSLVASLLSFAKRAPITRTPIDLNTLLRTSVKLAESQWQPLHIEVRTELDHQLPRVLGDSNQLLQVCAQILANALHLLEENGGRRLAICTSHHDGVAVLQFSAEVTEQSQSGEPSGEEDRGMLGLSACEGIVQEHRGRIWLEKAKNGGTTVNVELPVATSALQAAMKTLPQPA